MSKDDSTNNPQQQTQTDKEAKLQKIQDIAEALSTRIAEAEEAEATRLRYLVSATYALKKAIEFDYKPGVGAGPVPLANAADKLSRGQKLTDEPWTGDFFFKAAVQHMNDAAGKAFRLESVEQALFLLEKTVK